MILRQNRGPNTALSVPCPLERENGELKCKIQHINHETTLEKELMKNKLETKCELLTQKNKTQSDKINKLDLVLGEINKEMEESVHKVTAYTLDETEKELQNLESEPNVIVLHFLTNELMNKNPNDCVDRMTRMCDYIRTRFHNIKIVISLPTPRSDSEDHNSNGQLNNSNENQVQGR
ncbi:unnamed protein product [Mytilus coruscus]|uniref:Uncharacterized protein n=1 Tax=Mytilus coruscus TaxID=42192 RepID=A0A6J8CC43_MYTCO|nr:unnamed protein product [Mytilus coruscus]